MINFLQFLNPNSYNTSENRRIENELLKNRIHLIQVRYNKYLDKNNKPFLIPRPKYSTIKDFINRDLTFSKISAVEKHNQIIKEIRNKKVNKFNIEKNPVEKFLFKARLFVKNEYDKKLRKNNEHFVERLKLIRGYSFELKNPRNKEIKILRKNNSSLNIDRKNETNTYHLLNQSTSNNKFINSPYSPKLKKISPSVLVKSANLKFKNFIFNETSFKNSNKICNNFDNYSNFQIKNNFKLKKQKLF